MTRKSELWPWLVAAAGTLLLLLGALALWVWETIPPAPDPETLPSLTLEPPAAAHREAVAAGRAIARALVAEEKLPGLSLAVALDGELVWAEGFRWADMENETPVTPATRFRIGGVTETLTAAAVGRLVDRGRLDLDAPVERYLPSFPEKEWPLTARRLMAHAAGLRPYRGEGGIFLGPSCANDAERLALFADEPLRSRPGTEISYSARGWVLVGAVVAAAAGEPYLDFLRREILAPLGMQDTEPDGASKGAPATARFYYPRLMLDPRLGLQDSPALDLSCYLAALGLLSTPTDLVRFGAALLEGTLLEPATVEALLTPVELASGEATSRALGWFVETLRPGAAATPTRVVSQGLGEAVVRRPLSATTVGGQVAGGTAVLMLVPEHRLVIAVTTNVSGAGNASLLSLRLADLFL